MEKTMIKETQFEVDDLREQQVEDVVAYFLDDNSARRTAQAFELMPSTVEAVIRSALDRAYPKINGFREKYDDSASLAWRENQKRESAALA
jgi:hypothetical protein